MCCILSTDRAKEEFFNSTSSAVGNKNGINATHLDQDYTYYLSIYSGKPSICMFITTNVYNTVVD